LFAQGSRLARASHKLVEGVDTLHLRHDTESEVRSDPLRFLHELNGFGHHTFDLAFGALSPTVEILASPLSSHDRLVESAVPKLHVGNEAARSGGVIMDAHMGRVASTIAGVEPIFDPSHAIGVGARCWGDQHSITLVFQWFDILLPKCGTATRIHVRLPFFVRLVETHNDIGVTFLDEPLEIGELVLTPQHCHVAEAKSIGIGINRRTPGVYISNVLVDEGLDILLRTIGPSKTNLATTARRRWHGSRRWLQADRVLGRSRLALAITLVLVGGFAGGLRGLGGFSRRWPLFASL